MAVAAIVTVPSSAVFAASAQTCPAALPTEEFAVPAAISCGGEVAISGLTTETDSATATADGSIRWDHNYRPVRMRKGDAWTPIDTTLVPTSDGRLAPVATIANTSFSGGGDQPMVTVAKGDDVLHLASPLSALPAPVLSGNTATYPNVLPDVDLQLIADVDGFSQLLVVKNSSAARNPRLKKLTFQVAGKGLRLTGDSGGNLRTTNESGKVVMTGSAPTMWDATEQDVLTGHSSRGNGRARGNGQVKRMLSSITNNAITLTPDAAMLGAADTQFPAYIDPGLTLDRTAWSVVDTNLPTTAYWNSSQEAQVGTLNGGTTKRRSFFAFNMAGTAVVGRNVTAATLNLTETYSSSCTARQFNLYSTGPISSATTWNNQPTLGDLQSSATVAKGYSSTCPGGAVTMDATVAVHTAAASGGTVTLGLRAASETDNTYWKRFANNPTLSITYASDTDFGVIAGTAFTVGTELGSSDVKSKLLQLGYTSTEADQAIENVTQPTVTASEVIQGTPSDASIDPSDDSLYNEMWSAITGGGTPPPVTPDQPANVTATTPYSAVTEAEESADATVFASGIIRTGTYGIYSSWRDYAGRLSTIRNGYYNPSTDKGFGVEKLERKHNLPPSVAKSVMKRPLVAYFVSGKKWNYVSYDLHHIKCYWAGIVRRCKSVEKTQIALSHDARLAPNDNYPFGVVTAFCNTYVGKCPDWVRKTLN